MFTNQGNLINTASSLLRQLLSKTMQLTQHPYDIY